MNTREIVLTADRSLMSNYRGGLYFGFASCVPKRICPSILYHHFICPSVRINLDGSVEQATLGLRTVESICVDTGFKDVIVSHPTYLNKNVGRTTKVVGISVEDPLGKGPASTTWSTLCGGTPWNKIEFEKLMVDVGVLKKKFRFKVLCGGPGAWQLASNTLMNKFNIDVVLLGEAELTLPQLLCDLEHEKNFPLVINGKVASPEEIPPILSPTISQLIEITRGCGRDCWFCEPNKRGMLRSIPLEKIEKDAKVHLERGFPIITLHSDDTFRYESRNFYSDKDAIINLFKALFEIGMKRIFITHASLPTFAFEPELIESLTRLLRSHGHRFYGCQPGIETGSPRLISRYMRGKCLPGSPNEWPTIVKEAFKNMKRYKWYPVCTLIVGLPGEEKEDVSETMQLIKGLDDQAALFVPLLFTQIPLYNETKYFSLTNLLPEQKELMIQCWRHNVKYINHFANLIALHDSPLISKILIKVFCSIFSGVLRLTL